MTEKLIAFIRLLAPALSMALALFGVAIDADTLIIVFTIVASAGTLVWAWWKNNNLTKAAQEAQKVLEAEKEGVK